MNWDDNKKFYPGPKKKKRPTGKRRKKRRSLLSVLLTIALALTAFLLAAATTGYFLITHHPADYQPRQWNTDPKVRKQQQKLAEQWGVEKHNKLYNKTQENANKELPFVLRIEQKELNELLLIDEIQNQMRRRWPSFAQQFRQIQLSFTENKIKVMGQIQYRDIQSILTIAFAIDLSDSGNLHVTLDAVDVGALPIPKTVIQEQLDRIAEVLKAKRNPREEKKEQTQETENVEELAELLADLLRELIAKRNMAIPAEFPVDVNKKARVLALDIGQGYIDLTLKPFWVDD